MADEDLRRAYTHGAPVDHPDDEQWERLAIGEAGVVERAAVRAHVVRCAGCARVWRSLAALSSEARAFDPRVPATAFPAPVTAAASGRPRVWTWIGLAAAAALAGWIVVRPQAPPVVPGTEEPFRSGAADDRPVSLSPRGTVHDVSPGFRWRRAGGARTYRVRLLGPTGDRIWTSPALTGDSTPWPAGLDPKPGRYVWTVVALGGPSEGGELTSAPMAFEIRP